MLKAEGLSFSYPQKIVFKDISFELKAGDIMTILGPNGVGKSTLFDCLCRLKKPDTGKIYLDNKAITSYNLKQLANTITLLSQTVKSVFDFTVKEYILMGVAPRISPFGSPKTKDYEEVNQIMLELNIAHFADRIFTQLSGGEKQQISIAKAVLQKPKIILFDEPTSFLDIGNQQKILRLIKKMAIDGYCIIMTTHNPDHAIQLGGTCAIMHPKGHMTICKPNNLNQNLLSEIYNTPLHLLKINELDRYACLAAKLED